LDLINKLFKKSYGEEVLSRIKTCFHVLVSFGSPKMGSTLLRLADQLTLKKNFLIEVTALHITPSSEIKPQDAIIYEKEGFQPIRFTAQQLGLKVHTLYRNTEYVEQEITNTVHDGNYDLVLVGAAKPMFNDKITGGKLNQLLEESKSNVGVLLDRGFMSAENVLVLINSDSDKFLLQYAARFIVSNKARVTVLKTGSATVDSSQSPEFFKELIENRIPDKVLLSHFNLVLVSLEYWDRVAQMSWVKESPSILVIKYANDLKTDSEIMQVETIDNK
jgi:hypothetical protein